MWSPRWEFEYDSKTNSVKATKKSLCCPAKCIVAFKHCLLIKNQQKRITRCSVCRESCHTTPIKAPIHMKAISRQRQLFRSSPPCQPPVCSSTGVWQSVFVCVITLSAAGEASLLLVPATSPPECWQPLPVPGRSPGSARLKSPHRWHCCPASCGANEKPLWQLSWLARLPLLGVRAASYQLSGLITSNTRTAVYDAHNIVLCWGKDVSVFSWNTNIGLWQWN